MPKKDQGKLVTDNRVVRLHVARADRCPSVHLFVPSILRYLTFLLLLAALPLAASPTDSLPADGPYLTYGEAGELIAHWTWPEERRKFSAPWSAIAPPPAGQPGSAPAAAPPNKDGSPATALPPSPTFRPELIHPDRTFLRDPIIEFEGVDSLAVVSDIHGQFPVIRKLLIANGIVDESLRWNFGTGHFVIVGDVFDRGPQVNEVLWLLHNLELEAAAAGGRVHYLLGNHETMILADADVRYIHKRYLVTGALLKTAYQDLYGPDTYLGRWLRSKPLAVKINGEVYTHGGISKSLLREVSGLRRINDLYHKYIIAKTPTRSEDSRFLANLLHGDEGPLWYRGYFLDRDLTERDVDRILRKLGASRIIVGHTSFKAIQSFYDGRVLAVDSSMKFGSLGEVLLIRDGEYVRGDLLGVRRPLFNTP